MFDIFELYCYMNGYCIVFGTFVCWSLWENYKTKIKDQSEISVGASSFCLGKDSLGAVTVNNVRHCCQADLR